MMRRLIAVVGTLALALTILPNVPDPNSGSACCNGIMCPLHSGHPANCDANGSGTALKSCPVQAAAHYTATIVFVLLAPAVLHQELVSEPAIAFLPNLHSDVEPSVDSPPPRPLIA
jgi:hypothetical protein